MNIGYVADIMTIITFVVSTVIFIGASISRAFRRWVKSILSECFYEFFSKQNLSKYKQKKED